MGIRTIGNRGRYLIHDRNGRIIDNQGKGRALTSDRRVRAKKTVKSGYGHLGDLKRKKRRSEGVNDEVFGISFNFDPKFRF